MIGLVWSSIESIKFPTVSLHCFVAALRWINTSWETIQTNSRYSVRNSLYHLKFLTFRSGLFHRSPEFSCYLKEQMINFPPGTALQHYSKLWEHLFNLTDSHELSSPQRGSIFCKNEGFDPFLAPDELGVTTLNTFLTMYLHTIPEQKDSEHELFDLGLLYELWDFFSNLTSSYSTLTRTGFMGDAWKKHLLRRPYSFQNCMFSILLLSSMI